MATFRDRLGSLASDLRAQILSRINWRDQQREAKRDRRPDHWFVEQQTAIDSLRLAIAAARFAETMPDEFEAFARTIGEA